MKNDRYLPAAIALLREKKHAPDRVLALSDDDLSGLTLSLFNICQEIATEKQVDVEFEIDDETRLLVFEAAHKRDITLNEFVEQALEAVIVEHEYQQELTYRKGLDEYVAHCRKKGVPTMAWVDLPDEDREVWGKIADKDG